MEKLYTLSVVAIVAIVAIVLISNQPTQISTTQNTLSQLDNQVISEYEVQHIIIDEELEQWQNTIRQKETVEPQDIQQLAIILEKYDSTLAESIKQNINHQNIVGMGYKACVGLTCVDPLAKEIAYSNGRMSLTVGEISVGSDTDFSAFNEASSASGIGVTFRLKF